MFAYLNSLDFIQALFAVDLFILDLIGTAVFAYSGAIVARHLTIVHLAPNSQEGTVKARLKIQNMLAENGNIVYPSKQYDSIELTVKKTDSGWSKIRW